MRLRRQRNHDLAWIDPCHIVSPPDALGDAVSVREDVDVNEALAVAVKELLLVDDRVAVAEPESVVAEMDSRQCAEEPEKFGSHIARTH